MTDSGVRYNRDHFDKRVVGSISMIVRHIKREISKTWCLPSKCLSSWRIQNIKTNNIMVSDKLTVWFRYIYRTEF